MSPGLPPDEDTVRRVVHAMTDGITNSGLQPTASELLSACFTLTKRMIEVIIELSPDEPSRLRNMDAASNGLMKLFPENKVM